MKYKNPKVIAEIGCNHKGEMAIAKEMIQTASKFCKANVVKFQKRCNKELLTKKQFNTPHPNPNNSKSDGANMLELDKLESLLERLIRIRQMIKEF